MKYALVENDIVVQISLPPVSNWELVDDSVFAGFIRDPQSGEFINPNIPSGPTPIVQMKELWDTAPPWIKGPYQHFATAATRLATRDLEALKELIDSIEPTAAIAADPAKLEAFNAAMAGMKQIANDAQGV